MNTTTATAPELNAQLFLQLSNIADNESYLQKTLDFIIGLAKSENRTNARGRAYTELLERLSDFQEYEAGWDGDNALPLNHLVVKNFKNILPMELCCCKTKSGNQVSILGRRAFHTIPSKTAKPKVRTTWRSLPKRYWKS